MNYSFVIPHKNTPALLVRCLNSIPLREDVEIIVVDDNSDNVNWEELNKSVLPQFHLILNKASKGAGHARNIGLDACCGKWVIFADSDDFFSSACNKILDEYMDSDAEIIFFSVDSVNSDNVEEHSFRADDKIKLIANYRTTPSIENEDAIKFLYTEPWGKIYKADLIKRHDIRFSESRVCNDILFSYKASCYAPQVAVDERTLYVITFRSDSLSADSYVNYEKAITRLSEVAKSQAFVEQHYHPIEIYLLRSELASFLKNFPLKFMKAINIVMGAEVSKRVLLKRIFQKLI